LFRGGTAFPAGIGFCAGIGLRVGIGVVRRATTAARTRAAPAGAAGERVVGRIGFLTLGSALHVLGRRLLSLLAPALLLRTAAAVVEFVELVGIVVGLLALVTPRTLLVLLRAHVGDHAE